MAHGLVITSWPINLSLGSGTALFANALQVALGAAGHQVELINPQLATTDYTQFTLERLWWNTQLRDDAARLTTADWWLGLDYDGYAVPKRAGQFRLASARALFADLVETEPEPFRTLLRVQAFFDGHNFRQADVVVVPSAYAKRKALDYHALPEDKVRVIPNGIDLPTWDAMWDTVPEPDPLRRPTVLAVSKLYPRKKIDMLLQAAPLVREHFPEVEIRIAGGGFEWDNWRALAQRLGLEQTVTWLGDITRHEVVAEFKRCHVFTHPSIQETFGNVCLESMAAGKPLVVADAAAPAELVRDSGSGLVVPANEPEALANALIALLDDAERGAECGRRGRVYAERLTWTAAAQAYLALVP